MQVVVCTLMISNTLMLFNAPLSSLFIDATNPDRELIMSYVAQIMKVCLTVNFLNGTMQTLASAVRGMGLSVSAMLVTLTGACLMRVLWITFVFPLEPMNNVFGLFVVFPITWGLTSIIHLIVLTVAYGNFKRNLTAN